jgi:hypothetical protein
LIDFAMRGGEKRGKLRGILTLRHARRPAAGSAEGPKNFAVQLVFKTPFIQIVRDRMRFFIRGRLTDDASLTEFCGVHSPDYQTRYVLGVIGIRGPLHTDD